LRRNLLSRAILASVLMSWSCEGKLRIDADACKQPYPLTSPPEGPCHATVDNLPVYGLLHLNPKYDNPRYDIVYSCSNPPASGDHLPTWGTWGMHESPLARAHYVHNLEHGGVVLLYNCAALNDHADGGATQTCSEIVARLQAIVKGWPHDPICDSPVNARLIVTPDPLLDVPVAASAAEIIYRADCVDETTLTSFISTNYGMGAEDLCGEGTAK
jgi:hypothetical protein